VLTCVEEIHSVTYKVAIPIYKHGGWWQEKNKGQGPWKAL